MLFANPAFLWGLTAVAIPIAIHLFNFRRYRKVYFSNVDRLEELHSETRRQNIVRQWAVLLLRIAAVVFIVLAFARPVLPQGDGALRSGGTVVSVYIDNSFSMESADEGGSLLEAAKRKAREVAMAYRPDDRFQLLTCGMDGGQFRWLSREEFLDAVGAVEAVPAVLRLSEAAQAQMGFMQRSGAPNRHAYLVTDCQLTTCDLDNMPTDSTAQFTIVPVKGVVTDNLYIDTVMLNAPAYFAGGRVQAEVSVLNGGSRDVEKVPVRLYVNGRERAMATLDIAAGGSGKALLHFSIDSAGWIEGRVEITDYPITFDDSYHFALHAGTPIRMLELDGREPNVNVRRLFEADSAVRYRAAQSAAYAPRLAECDMVLLNEVTALPSGTAREVAAWVADGGTLAVIPPAEGPGEDLNVLLAMLQAPTLEQWGARRLKATELDYNNRLYRNVFNGWTDEMEMPTVMGCYRLATGGALMQRVITLADGSGMLVHTPCGQGHVYLFALPLAPQWTDLAEQALFVPTFYNMALYSRPQPATSHTLGTASPIALQGTYSITARPPELTGPGGVRLLPDLRQAGGRQVLTLHGELTEAGIYRLADERLAFNYDRAESVMAFADLADIGPALRHKAGYAALPATDRPVDEVIRERSGGRQLWRLCLVAALVALAAEEVLLRLSQRKKKQ